MRKLTPLSALLCVFVASAAASAQQVSFKMEESLMRMMATSENILPTLRVRVNAHGPLHTLGNDCEMHVAGSVIGDSLGTPPAVVVEFPNWCKFNPQGQLGLNFDTLSDVWD